MLLTITLTEREAGRLLAALRTLANDYETRAMGALAEAKALGDHSQSAVAEKGARDYFCLRGQTDALIDRIEAAREG